MEPITIIKERNTLTIEVNGRTWKTTNTITKGDYAGKVFVYRCRSNSNARAIEQARGHARANGWEG